MPIPVKHAPIKANDQTFDLSHLDAFKTSMKNMGIEGADLIISVVFSTHAFTERATHGRPRNIQDQSGTWRTFCPDRYEFSLLLPAVMKDFIEQNKNASISQDYNKGSNLLIVETVDGKSWAVFFCFEPALAGLQLSVLSVYAKTGNMHRKSKFNKASYYARQCLFLDKRVP